MQPIPDLEQILGSTAWVLVGGIALRAYIPERMTLDVDILIHERDAAVMRDALCAAGYRILGQRSIGGFSAQLPAPESAPLDVLTRSDSWLEGALANPMRDAAGHPVLARPYLLLLKLQAGRTQDLADVQRLLATAAASERAAMRSLIEHHSPELVEDYDALCTLADLEFGSSISDINSE